MPQLSSSDQEGASSVERVSVEDLRPGLVVGGAYRLERRIGEGGMGVVWAAERSGEPSVALKFLKDPGASRAARRRFLGEARVASAIRHPHVRAVHDVLELPGGLPVLVMQRLEGEPLSARLKREGKLSVAETAEIAIAVVSAVGAAHALGVVHRDLKPENVFLATGGGTARVQVLDFGIAKSSLSEGETDSLKTASGALLGTPCFMAPEQVFGEAGIDHRADVWALGLILYQCLSGVLPTRAENVGQVMKIIVARAIPALRERCPEVPAELADLVGRMLVRERRARLAELSELMRELERHTDARAPAFGPPLVTTAQATDDEILEPVSGVATLSESTDTPRSTKSTTPVSREPERPAPRRRWVLWAATSAAIGVAGVVGTIAWKDRSAASPAAPTAATVAAGADPGPTAEARPADPPALDAPSASPRAPDSSPSSSAPRAPASGRASQAPPRASAKPSAAPTSSAFAPSERFE